MAAKLRCAACKGPAARRGCAQARSAGPGRYFGIDFKGHGPIYVRPTSAKACSGAMIGSGTAGSRIAPSYQSRRARAGQRVPAGVAELVDALDLGSSGASHGGSSPSARTIGERRVRLLQAGQEHALRCGGRGGEMQVTETSSTGLKRELKVIIEQGELGAALCQPPRRGQGPGPAQGLPQGQGAAGAPQEAVRPLADGRGAGEDGRGDEPQGASPTATSARRISRTST